LAFFAASIAWSFFSSKLFLRALPAS